MIQPFYWEFFSKKLRERIERLHYVGFFTPPAAQEKQMRLVVGKEDQLAIYWLVDETDGVIADVKFQAFGPIALIAAADVACELVLRKTYTQASRLGADLLDQHLRDRKEQQAFPSACSPALNQVLAAIDRAVQQCADIPAPAVYDTTPIESDFGAIPGGLPGWEDFPEGQKRQIIEEVIEKEIRPYIELDAGGVQLVELRGNEVIVVYEGSCTTCPSSTGSTLSAIQQILKARVHPSLVVAPQF